MMRGRVFRRHIEVNGLPVELYVSPDAQLKYMKLSKQAFDVDLIRIAECFVEPRDCVWDIGANIGVFTFAAASIANCGTVVAIEADTWLASLMRKTCRLRSHLDQDIRIVPVAIADQDTVLTLRIAGRGRASNALSIASGSSQMGGVREEQHVPSLTLDSLLKTMPKPDFVKIDVEGAECLVLSGAKTVIRAARPVFYIEVAEKSFPDVISLFDASNYTTFDERGSVVQTWTASNFFFVPNESAAKLKAMETFRSLSNDEHPASAN